MPQDLYKLPKGWAWKPLSELGDFTGGGTPSKGNSQFWNGDIPWITPKDMKQRELFDSEMRITQEAVKRSSAKFIPPNSVLIVARSGILRHTLPVCMNRVEATVNQDIKVFMPSSKISPEYCQYMLKGHEKYILSELVKGGVTVESLKFQEFKSQPFPLPPLAEQERIVEKLDALFRRIDAATARLNQILTHTQALFASAMNRSFAQKQKNWKLVNLSEVCAITSKLSDPREDEFLDLIHVGGANIESMTGKLLNLQTAREEKLISAKFPFDEGMVLYSKIRPYLKKVVRPDIKGLCSADIYPLTPNELLDRDFLFYLLLTENFSTYAIQGSSRAGMPKVNRDHLFKYNFPLPPLDEQHRIVAQLDGLSTRIRKLEKTTRARLAHLAALKSSLLDAAFRGKL